jgi:hypothetical protein
MRFSIPEDDKMYNPLHLNWRLQAEIPPQYFNYFIPNKEDNPYVPQELLEDDSLVHVV